MTWFTCLIWPCKLSPIYQLFKVLKLHAIFVWVFCYKLKKIPWVYYNSLYYGNKWKKNLVQHENMLNTHVITCEMIFVWILITLDENGCGLTIFPLGYFKSWTIVWCENLVVNGMFDFNVVDHKFFGEVYPTSQYLCVWLCGKNEDLPKCSHKLYVDHVMVFNDDLFQGFHRFHQTWRNIVEVGN
jgi:hypothetical protein